MTTSHAAAWKALDSKKWAGVLAYNEFTHQVVAVKPTPWRFEGKWTDAQDVYADIWFHEREIRIGSDTVTKLVVTKALENVFHPVIPLL